MTRLDAPLPGAAPLVTRFAPAPTGYLHLGHVANAICVWGAARAARGEVVLRVEDHDRERCRPEYETALLDDLDWLGFVPDRYPTAAFRAGACASRQRDRHATYAEAAGRLARAGQVYGCACSRRDLAAAVSGSGASEVRYPGTCRDRGLALDAGVGWRVRIAPGLETFVDAWHGPQTQDPARQCGDVLIRDRRGNWTYQFVAAIDDYLQGITHVIRGLDLLPSTGRQIRLARMLGRAAPATFAHHPLLMKSPAQKLSKSDGDTGVRDLRAGGWSRDAVLDAAHARLDAAWQSRETRA